MKWPCAFVDKDQRPHVATPDTHSIASSLLAGLVKTGRLGDISAALPRALQSQMPPRVTSLNGGEAS
ncbi:hypothetical protein C1Y18_20965 [Pseudomonas sp. MPR-R5A]|nr:hypothetical protein C1Y25_16610 [Pseudomonas sp. MPBC4-3]PMX46063.1 hypothetical protein C1Y20_18395 [Pseudomonas sp. FW301-21B01]PMY05041.1 hypothetical protein C1Y18_20965 [Pseudomonas sp. MPR-R5A]PNA67647.1 hypothetical protein C1Y14_16400 [Pseudomonas sp. MPR-R5B]